MAFGSVLSSPSAVWLSLRTIWWMGALPVLKRVLPLPRLVRLMWRETRSGRPRQRAWEERTTQLVTRLCSTSGGNCLERSLILYRYFSEIGADPELVVAMGRPEEYVGHVWVVVDAGPLIDEPAALRDYAELVRFGAHGGVVE